MFGYKLVKVEKEKTEAENKETDEKKGDKKMTKKGKIALGLSIAAGVIGAAAVGGKKYLDSRKEDSYAELGTGSDVEDEVEDLDQEETTDEESED